MSSRDAGSCGPEGSPRAAAALCGLYREAGQRLRHLQEQLAARDALVERLRARLSALEGDAAPSLVDALLEQVARLREQLQESESGAAETALRQEVERLRQRLAERDQELEQLLSRPALASEQELVQLRRSVAEKERARAASQVLCRSLAGESQQLRRTLAATAHMCQHLAKCLEQRQAPQGTSRESSAEVGAKPESPGQAAAQAATVKLQEENRLLKEKVAYVEDLNAKWQRYDASRDEYVRGLQAQLRGLQAPTEPERPSASERMRKEIARLNGQLEEKMLVCAEAEQELQAARRARDEALERVQVLEQQILTYKDDFAWERADRERAQSRAQALEEKLACLQQARRQEPLEAASCRSPGASSSSQEASERAVSRGWRPGDGARRPEPPAESRHLGMPQGDLQCPHCLQCFSDEQGEELFMHVGQCCQ